VPLVVEDINTVTSKPQKYYLNVNKYISKTFLRKPPKYGSGVVDPIGPKINKINPVFMHTFSVWLKSRYSSATLNSLIK
jgi:hypothetical protein